MARVNHKRVKQLIQEKQGKITDQEFFTSRLLAIHLEDLAAAQTRRYGVNRREMCIRDSNYTGPSSAMQVIILFDAISPFFGGIQEAS